MKEFSILARIFRLLRGIHIHPMFILGPVFLSLGAAAFEGMSLGLLIPLLHGFLIKDFSFIKEAPGLSVINGMFPEGILRSDKALFTVLLSIFVVAVILKNILRYTSIMGMRFIAVRAMHHLRKNLFQRYLSFGKLYFDSTAIGHHSTVLTHFSKFAVRPILVIDKYVNAFFSFMVYIAVMAAISWQLTVLALPLFAVLHFSVRRLIEAIRRYSHAMTDRLSALTERGIEILSNMPLVKSYDAEDAEKSTYAAISDAAAQIELKGYRVHELILPFQELLTLFSALLLFSGMLYLLLQGGDANAPSFIVYFYLVLNAANKFGTLTSFRSAVADASGALEEVEKIFGAEEKYVVPSGSVPFAGLRGRIEFRNLDFTFPNGRRVLHGISFAVKRGETVAIVGPTGAGKTTIINLLMRFYDCAPGALFIDGTDIRSFITADLHRHMALVSQDTLLLHDSLRNNVAYGLKDVSDAAIADALASARLSVLLEKLPERLETRVGDRGVKLSGGEKQRLSIARALLKNAEILILDEATSSLDSATEKLIQEAIRDAVANRTAIVIAHRLSTIQHADRIVVVDEGRVVETGTLEELLLKRGKFYALWEGQRF